jgi:hypothetical protein
MSSAIFTSGGEAYQVANIVYAGPVAEIPEDRRRNGSTHSFKMVTVTGTSFSYYKDVETARKARGALGAMLDTLKPKAFRHGNEFLDPSRVVSFSNVVAFKNPVESCTHGFVVSVETCEEKNRELWLRYKSEDHARKGRKALWACVHSANGMSNSDAKVEEPAPVADSMPF